MCVRCKKRRDCLRMINDYLSAKNYSILESRMKHLFDRENNFCLETLPGIQTYTPTSQNKKLVAENFATALLQKSRKGTIQCDIGYENWFCEPDPVKRQPSWHKVTFIEYVSSSVVSAHVKDKQILLTVRLFPMLSVGYVPFVKENSFGVYSYEVIWPSSLEDSWIPNFIPKTQALLIHSMEHGKVQLKRSSKTNFDIQLSAHQRCDVGERYESGFLEFRVALPLDTFETSYISNVG